MGGIVDTAALAYAQVMYSADTLRQEQYLYRLALANCLHTLEALYAGRLTSIEASREIEARMADCRFALALEAA